MTTTLPPGSSDVVTAAWTKDKTKTKQLKTEAKLRPRPKQSAPINVTRPPAWIVEQKPRIGLDERAPSDHEEQSGNNGEQIYIVTHFKIDASSWLHLKKGA